MVPGPLFCPGLAGTQCPQRPSSNRILPAACLLSCRGCSQLFHSHLGGSCVSYPSIVTSPLSFLAGITAWASTVSVLLPSIDRQDCPKDRPPPPASPAINLLHMGMSLGRKRSRAQPTECWHTWLGHGCMHAWVAASRFNSPSLSSSLQSCVVAFEQARVGILAPSHTAVVTTFVGRYIQSFPGIQTSQRGIGRHKSKRGGCPNARAENVQPDISACIARPREDEANDRPYPADTRQAQPKTTVKTKVIYTTPRTTQACEYAFGGSWHRHLNGRSCGGCSSPGCD